MFQSYFGQSIVMVIGILISFSTIIQLYGGCKDLLMEKAGIPGENTWSVASHRQILSYKAVLSTRCQREEWWSVASHWQTSSYKAVLSQTYKP